MESHRSRSAHEHDGAVHATDDLILRNPDQAGNAGKTPEFKELLTKLGKYTQRGGKKDV